LLGRFRIGPIVLLAASLPASIFADGKLAQFRSRFQKETDPVHRAKLMPQLGEAQFEEINKDIAADKLPEALSVLQQYRDDVQSCAKTLDAKIANPEKHPSGFKELEFSLRESLRRLDDILVSFTADDQAAFRAVRSDLDQTDRHLIRELFPGQPQKDSGEKSSD
jgi:hypothetical protein